MYMYYPYFTVLLSPKSSSAIFYFEENLCHNVQFKILRDQWHEM